MRNRNKSRKVVSLSFGLLIICAFIYLIFDLEPYIFDALDSRNWNPITNHFKDFGILAPLAFGLIQFLTILITFLPAGPLQIISGITIGPALGSIAGFIGIFLGNIVIYLLANKLGKRTEDFYTDTEISDLIQISKNKSLRLLILLYFIPVVPYGLIAYSLAKSKIRFSKYIIITTLSIIPLLIINNLFGYLITEANMIVAVSLTLCLLIISIIVASSQYQITHYLSNKPIKDINYFRLNVRKPNLFFYSLFWFIFYIYFKFKLNYRFDKKSLKVLKNQGILKGPFLLLYNHPSFLDWGYAYIPLFPRRVNSIIAYAYFCNYKFGKLLHLGGGFPKYLYQADISSIKNIKKVIKNDGILGMAPEGRLSAYGVLEQLAPGIEKLIKHLDVPVIYAKIQGGYLSKPKWALKMKKGKVIVNYNQIFTKEMIKHYSLDEIKSHLNEEFHYDDFAWQEKVRIKWKGKGFAEGLENILYICPVCHHEYTTQTKDNHIFCTNCNTDVTLNNYYEFVASNEKIPRNIRDWFLLQKEIELKNIDKEDFILESNVTLKLPDPNGKGFSVVGVGKTSLTINGLKYVGTINDEVTEVFIDRQNITALPFGANEDFEIYYNNTLYYFVPNNKRESVKYSILAELIFNKYEKDSI